MFCANWAEPKTFIYFLLFYIILLLLTIFVASSRGVSGPTHRSSTLRPGAEVHIFFGKKEKKILRIFVQKINKMLLWVTLVILRSDRSEKRYFFFLFPKKNYTLDPGRSVDDPCDGPDTPREDEDNQSIKLIKIDDVFFLNECFRLRPDCAKQSVIYTYIVIKLFYIKFIL